MSETAILTLPDKNLLLELPIYTPVLGQQTVDVSSLVKEGLFTYDPGFLSTAACWSKITYINGGKGVLLHRGYPIEQWVEKSHYMNLCYALLNDKLALTNEITEFSTRILNDMPVCTHIQETIKAFPQDVHPMAPLMAAVSVMAGENQKTMNKKDLTQQTQMAEKLIAQMPTIVAMTYRHRNGLPFMAPKKSLSYAENFLYMMFADSENYQPDSIAARAMDTIFILHADHEQNASTSTVRLAGSTGTDPYAAIVAGIAALWGPAHGGANEAVVKMLEQIGDVSNIDKFIERAKNKDDSFRLMGFGHRVYKNTDPRAIAMKKACESILNQLGDSDNPLLVIAKKLEEIALNDRYFIDRKLFPNVDFYSGIILKTLHIPTYMYTSIFALARASGWIAQYLEMYNDPKMKIGRPRQLYIGEAQRNLP
ncbi:citrate synthase [Fastidiosibacter lacustris]|uniref:citrate synthase n=1 Tax=Fastidiosibacter lacustris TaxID=2056695 RepID=UPI000E351F5C|nr:citrate synthase [Fastidiosibacter lacustris]